MMPECESVVLVYYGAIIAETPALLKSCPANIGEIPKGILGNEQG